MFHNINCKDRILEWRVWRQGLNKLSWEDSLKEVNSAWSLAPRVNHYLTPDIPDEWPNPWELINDNIYCDLSIALGMYYTIALTDHILADTAKIEIYKTNEGWINLCSVEHGLYMLNYFPFNIVNKSIFPIKERPTFVYSKVELANKLH